MKGCGASSTMPESPSQLVERDEFEWPGNWDAPVTRTTPRFIGAHCRQSRRPNAQEESSRFYASKTG